MSQQVELNDEQKRLIKVIFDEVRMESRMFREYLIPQWRRNEAFWNNIQRAIATESGDFTTTVRELVTVANLPLDTVELYERIINIYRAHGESFVSALSASLPAAVYSPDDADNASDISTAKAYQKITQLIQTKEEAPLKFIKMLYHLYNHGVAFVYNHNHIDKKYGEKKTPIIDYKTVIRKEQVCPDCGSPREDEASSGMGIDPMAMMGEEQMDPMMMEQAMMEQMACPSCGSVNPPVEGEVPEDVPYISSIDTSPKGCEKIDVYGPLHVTVQPQIKKLEETGFLILDTDLDKAFVRSLYEDQMSKENERKLASAIAANSDENRLERIPANTPYIEENNLSTVTRFWLQPWMFWRLENKTEVEELQKVFKKGAYVVIINEEFIVEACDENLIECWTATESALSEKIHAEPYGNVMIPLQEMTNDLIALTMETIESGIPINFFDPSLIDGKEFKKRIAQPGDFIPGKPRNGMGLDASLASTKAATLPQEISFVTGYLEKMAQFCLGTLPSVFGGQAQGGSETLGEYKESRAQALQRLSLPYVCAATAWVYSMKKASTEFINYLIETDDDAKYVQDLGNGNFINVWVKQAELEGKVGDVTVENSEQIPISYNQRRAMIMDLVMNSVNVPQLQAVLYHPENVGLMKNTFGLTEFYIPGDDDRDKQLREIKELIQGQAMPGALDPTTGMPGPEISSVPIDPDVDNHPVHIEIIKAFLVSEVGQILKRDNPNGYQNILAHLAEHNQFMMMQPPPPMEAEPSGNKTQEGPVQ